MSWICPYCQKEATNACLYQKQYESASKKLDITTFEIYCSAGLTVSERSLFDALIAPKVPFWKSDVEPSIERDPYYTQKFQ